MYLQKCQMILIPIIMCKKTGKRENVNVNQKETENVRCVPALPPSSTEEILRAHSMPRSSLASTHPLVSPPGKQGPWRPQEGALSAVAASGLWSTIAPSCQRYWESSLAEGKLRNFEGDRNTLASSPLWFLLEKRD